MRNKFLLFSLSFVVALLVFLICPQISLAQQAPAVNSGAVGAGLITANASGTITGAGTADTIGGCGFVWGTQSSIYTATSSKFDEGYATSSEFGWEITAGGEYNSSSTLSKGTVYYLKTYASTTVSTVYGATEKTFLTGVDVPSNLSSRSTEDSIKIMWTAGTGAEKTVVRYNDGTTYPTATSSGSGGDFTVATNITFYNLPKEHTYYFSLWSSTSDANLTTTSESYVTIKAATTAAVGGGITRVAPTTYSDSLVINAGAATTQTREVTLTIKAGDASLMTICNRSDLLNCPLENYATTKSWTLTEGDGVKTVYAKFLSPDGLNSGLVSDTITLETPAPAPAEEEVIEEEVPIEEEVVEEVPAEEVAEEVVTAESLRAKITELQQKLIDLLKQLIQLLQQQIAELLGE